MAEVTQHELETARRVGAVLLEARKAIKLSLRDLERSCGLSGAAIFRMERAVRIPTLRSLMALSGSLPVRIVIEGGDAYAEVLPARQGTSEPDADICADGQSQDQLHIAV